MQQHHRQEPLYTRYFHNLTCASSTPLYLLCVAYYAFLGTCRLWCLSVLGQFDDANKEIITQLFNERSGKDLSLPIFECIDSLFSAFIPTVVNGQRQSFGDTKVFPTFAYYS